MRRAVAVYSVFAVCFLFFSGCVTLDPEGPDDFSTPALLSTRTSGSSRASLPPGTVIWEWSSAAKPLTGTLTQSNPADSGSNGVFFRINGSGSVETSDGALSLGGTGRIAPVRLVIGGGEEMSSEATAASLPPNTPGIWKHIPGPFDFSQGTFRLTIEYKNAQGGRTASGADFLLRIFINNNSGFGTNGSVLGTSCILRHYEELWYLTDGNGTGTGIKADVSDSETKGNVASGKLIITFTPSEFNIVPPSSAVDVADSKKSLETAFINFLCPPGPNSRNGLDVTGIKLEKL